MQQVPSPTRPLMKAAANRAADEGQLCTGIEGSAVRQYLLHQALPLYLQQYLQGLLCTIAALFAITEESAECDYIRLQALPLHRTCKKPQ